MVAIPSESCNEKAIIHRIREEMEIVGFDKIEIDPMGNLLGYIGTGKHLIAMDAHVDTVGPGNMDNWAHDPYQGYEDDLSMLIPACSTAICRLTAGLFPPTGWPSWVDTTTPASDLDRGRSTRPTPRMKKY
jgi:hypothetical protein